MSTVMKCNGISVRNEECADEYGREEIAVAEAEVLSSHLTQRSLEQLCSCFSFVTGSNYMYEF